MRIKNKIISVLMSLCMITSMIQSAVPVSAEDNFKLRVEAEDYTELSGEVYEWSEGAASGGKYMYTSSSDGNRDVVHQLAWEFSVPESGYYKITGAATKRNVHWISDYIVYVNDESNKVETYTSISDIPNLASNSMETNSWGVFYLEKGKNKLYFRSDRNDPISGSGKYSSYIDYFDVEKATSSDLKLTKVKFSDRLIGFYENTENVVLELDYSMKLDKEKKYSLYIEDAWKRPVMDKEIVAGTGDKALFALGRFKNGWYRIYVKDESGKLVNDYMAFTVVTPLKDRTNKDSSIATDVAATYDYYCMDMPEEIARVLKLQGFNWIRERANTWYKREDAENKMLEEEKKQGFNITSITEYKYGEVNKIKEFDLYDVYKDFRDVTKLNPALVDMYEFQNEPDLWKRPPELPDSQIAMHKAITIGLLDSGEDPYVAMAGNAYVGDYIFFDLQLQNDMMKYSNIYNFHAYDGLSAKSEYARKVSNAYSPEDNIRPVYATENGLACWPGDDGIFPENEQINQARYAITGAIDLLTTGTDKRFYFLSRPWSSPGGSFGTFHSTTYQPYPITAVFANMITQLGEADYRGIMTNMPEGVKAFLFDDGAGHDTAVIYSNNQNYINLKADKITYSDMYGYEETKYADKDGNIKLLVSADPIFAKFDGRCDESLYYDANYDTCELKKITLDTNDRIVLNALWDDQDYNDTMVMSKGYIFQGEENEQQHISLRVYNLNDEEVEGTIEVTPEYDGIFDIAIENPDFKLKPFEQTVVKITLTTQGTKRPGTSGDIKFCGKLKDGRELSPAVCRYWFYQLNQEVKDEDMTIFDGYEFGENWDLTNIEVPGIITADTDVENRKITMHFDHNGGRVGWLFPKFYLKDQTPETMKMVKESDGIVFRRQNSGNAVGGTNNTTLFAVMKDGRSYWSGDGSGVPFSTDELTLTYPWEVFALYSSPLGLNDVRDFNPEEIDHIMLGVSGSSVDSPIPDTTIWDFGVYKASSDIQTAHNGKMIINGAENEQHFKNAAELKLSVDLPTTEEVDDIRVVCGTKIYNKWKREGDKVIIDTSDLKRGYYTFNISAKNRVDYRYISVVNFYIDN